MNSKYIAFLFYVVTPVICVADTTSTTTTKTYELDMFSLLSFGLTIAALFLSMFMAWLSWQFYVKSTESTDKTNETVTKIETLVAGIQANITEIVQRTVGYWIESGGGDGQVTQSKQEVYEKLNELEQAIHSSASGSGDATSLLKEVSALKTQIDELGRGIRESQIKTLFPNIDSEQQAVKYSQEITSSSDTEQIGIIKIHILRSTTIATATVKFTPPFQIAPKMTANLVASPYEDDSEISAKPGTAGLKICNIHLNSNKPLKLGEYVFEFIAKQEQ